MKKATTITKSKTTPATPAPVPEKKIKSPAKTKAPAKPKAAPAVKATSSVPASTTITTITAMIDIGFGNTLWLRGDGPSLSWEKGVPMDCVADNKWSLTLTDAGAPVVFKFLVNDLSWSAGNDFVVAPGGTIALTPAF